MCVLQRSSGRRRYKSDGIKEAKLSNMGTKTEFATNRRLQLDVGCVDLQKLDSSEKLQNFNIGIFIREPPAEDHALSTTKLGRT